VYNSDSLLDHRAAFFERVSAVSVKSWTLSSAAAIGSGH
jgi:hypothetical protein